jgi:hypothetical protein
MPDHWSIYSGIFAVDVDVMEDTNGISGKRYVRINSTTGGVRSGIFPIVNEAMEASRYGGLYRLSWWRNAGTGNSAGANYDVLLRLLDYADAEVNILTVFGSQVADDKKGHWVKVDGFVELRAGDASARSLQLQFKGKTGATCQISLDECRVQYLGSPWYYVGDTANFTDNYEPIPAFAGTWANFDAGTHTKAAFRRDQTGRIWLKGFIKSGTINTAAFTLPPGFRPGPSNWNTTGKKSETNTERIEIDTAGVVKPIAGDTTYISLDGINFLAGY